MSHHNPYHAGERLQADHQALIKTCDTLFVASAHPEQGIDASHRGGRPGFVQILSDRLLRIPDYPGNGMFNTLGNFHSYPFAGLAFLDFRQGRLLQLTGEVEILWQESDTNRANDGAERAWQFRVDAWQASDIGFDIDWTFVEYSPFNP